MNMLSLTWWRQAYAKGGRLFAVGCALVFIIPIVIGFGSNFYGRGAAPAQRDQNGIAFTIDGSPVTLQEYNSIAAQAGGPPGQQYVSTQGQIIRRFLQQKIIAELAKQQNVHPSDADIDRAVAQARDQAVKSGQVKSDSDADWDAYLSEQQLTADEFRDKIASGQVLVEALLNHYKAKENITPQDAKNQSSQVRIIPVTILAQAPPSPLFPTPPGQHLLPDADARKKAEDLLAKVKAGADILAIAKANSADYHPKSKTPGISDWTNEYTGTPYGPDFEKALQKTPVGQLTDVEKMPGFRPGYVFAKVVDRKDDLPKDFNEKKVMDDLRTTQATKRLAEDFQTRMQNAKVVFPANQADKKAYYDSYKLEEMQQEMFAPMMGQPSVPNPPTQADIDAQQKLIDADFEAMLKQMPDNPTACLMVAPILEKQMFSAPPAEQNKIRDRIISLYETALKSEGGTQFADTSLTLADLYRDKHDYKDADKQYKQVDKVLNQNPAWDLNSCQTELSQRNKLLTGFKSIQSDVPDAAASIASEETRITTLQSKLADFQAKAAADRQKQEEEQKLEALKARMEQEKQKATPTPPSGAPTSGASAPATSGGPAPTTGAAPPTRGAVQPSTPAPSAPGSGASTPSAGATGQASPPGGKPAPPATPGH